MDNNQQVFDVKLSSQKIEHVNTLLKEVEMRKDELKKCGIYLNENITTNNDEWNAYFGL